jgi:hypothetical protein
MGWIEKTPAGRLGFKNYKELEQFCERHNVEVPTIPRRDWVNGTTVYERDWARLERERGDYIRHLREDERRGYVPVADIARLFGLTRQRGLAILKGNVNLTKYGRAYVVKREEAKATIDFLREELERRFIRRRTGRVGKEKRNE